MIDTRNLTKNVGATMIAGGLISILAFVTWALIYRAIPPENKESLTLLLGVLSANVGIVVGYFFGSSTANRTKDETIARALAGQLQDKAP
jgi:hypothetical protein